MPTLTQIAAAPTTLSAEARAQALTLISSSSRYREQAGMFPGLEAKLDAATTVQIQQINAALALLDPIIDGTVALTGGEEGVDYDQVRDQQQLIDYMIDTLFRTPVVRAGIATSQMNRVRGAWCSRCGIYRHNCPCP
jgi:hypothetical protein